jgi:cephalosporin hydroxylase
LIGSPAIQLTEDVIRAHEVIWRAQLDVSVETGVTHGGSLMYYVSLCKVIGKGRVSGLDIEIRLHNRQAIEAHPLSSLISLVDGILSH